MATDEENLAKLKASRDNIIERIQEMTLKPKPDYDIDGQKFSWTAYNKHLFDLLRNLQAEIEKLDGLDEHVSVWYN